MKQKKLKLNIYTDGSCLKNPGKGGWAYIATNSTGEIVKKSSGGERYTTNNRMEITAILEALSDFKKMLTKNKISEYDLKIYSDSEYCVNAYNKKWLKKWLGNGWKTNKGSEVLNRDLWEEFIDLSDDLEFDLIKVKGHAGNELNEKVDELARLSASSI